MGRTGKYLILLLLFLPSPVNSQDTGFNHTDSLTYAYYSTGRWEDLIREGESALKAGYDYKFLRQRIGFAYFSKGDYYSARKHFYKALGFDSYDQFTLEYLWWSGLMSGKEEYSGKLADAMFAVLRKSLSVHKFKPVESIDFESNYKFTSSGFRTGALYYRAGAGTRLGYRLTLYQSFSDYRQKIAENFTSSAEKFRISQPGYYAALTWNASPGIVARSAFHYFRTSSGANIFPGLLFQLGIAPDLNRFILELKSSYLTWNEMQVLQPEIQLGYVFPGRSSFYVKGSVAWLLKEKNNLVYSPGAGIKLWKDAWLEFKAGFGRMEYYNDFNGLYVYNSYDPSIMRTGASFTYYLNNTVSLWLNYTFEKKEYYNYSIARFNQYSYLGGLKWRL